MIRLVLNNDITEYYIKAPQEVNLSQFTVYNLAHAEIVIC